MITDEIRLRIKRELTTAGHARNQGNEGMVRVCARRAAGVAITAWLQSNPRAHWRSDAMGQLSALREDESLSEEVRNAAARLVAKVTDRLTHPFSSDPVEDSKTIIRHLLGKDFL